MHEQKTHSETRLENAKERLRDSISELGSLINSQNKSLQEEQNTRKKLMKDLDFYIEKIELILSEEE